ncbi:hypothetical protein MMC26_000720 [Xylographa opegraphella]|nr:hypothetical protein [Xylographa opegraphella]
MAHSTLDLSLFTHGDEAERHQLALSLVESLSRDGFVVLVNHGISDLTVEKLFEWSKSFFRLKLDDKASIAHHPGPNPQRGWSGVGAENSSALYRKGLLKSTTVEDLKDAREHFDIGSTADLQYPNKWPDEKELPGFRHQIEAAFEALEAVSAHIMKALEVAFGLPKGAFLDKMTHTANASEMRLNHYPAIDIEEIRAGGVSRIWPHFDLGVITLLFQDRVGGLEFEDRKNRGTFTRLECCGSSEMVVNVSETLQRWTNDVLAAGLHRVNIPRQMEDKETAVLPERYSIAYFCKADRDASVGPLQQFVHEGKLGTSLLLGLLGPAHDPIPTLTIADIFITASVSSTSRLRQALPSRAPSHPSISILPLTANGFAAQVADVVILACPPSTHSSVLQDPAVRQGLLDHGRQGTTKSKVLISLLGGVRIAQLERSLYTPLNAALPAPSGTGRARCAIVRAVPNIAARQQQSVTILSTTTTNDDNNNADDPNAIVAALFARVGVVRCLPEAQLARASALAASGVAFYAHLMKAAAKGVEGGEDGLAADDAIWVAAHAARGAAALVLAGDTPEGVVRAVATEKGSTAAGLKVLAQMGAGEALRAAVAECGRVTNGLGGGREK